MNDNSSLRRGVGLALLPVSATGLLALCSGTLRGMALAATSLLVVFILVTSIALLMRGKRGAPRDQLHHDPEGMVFVGPFENSHVENLRARNINGLTNGPVRGSSFKNIDIER